MSDTIPNLWSNTKLKPVIKTPLAILRAQMAPLAQATQGLLKAQVEAIHQGANIVLTFDVIAPALNNYRQRLLSVQYADSLIYPAIVSGNGLVVTRQETSGFLLNQKTTTYERKVESKTAYSEDDFIEIVSEVLRTPETTALLQSLIARSNGEDSQEAGGSVDHIDSGTITSGADFAKASDDTVQDQTAADSTGRMPEGNIPGVQTGGHAIDGSGMPDTRGIIDRIEDTVTGNRIDDETGKPV